MGATLAEVLRRFGAAYLADHRLSSAQQRVWRAIVACRTPALGGRHQRCDGCEREQWLFNSCRNRHCPQCQSSARDAWRQARLAELLPVPYCHLVFTLPHALNALAAVHALSKVFRAKFIDALRAAQNDGELERDPSHTPSARHARLKQLARHDWVVYAKTALAGPETVLDYLSRYTHRVAVSNERIVGISEDAVRLRVRAHDKGNNPRNDPRNTRTITIDGSEFIGRFLQHVLPNGFKRIRHYGLLSPALKTERLATARAALNMPAAVPQAREDAAAFLERVAGIDANRCPHCRIGHWRTIRMLEPARPTRTDEQHPCRGPP